jgi:hypothetical protein
MRAKDFISEAKLTPGELFVQKHLDWRPAALLKKLQDRTPFVDALGPNGNQYIPAKGEFSRLKPIIDAAVKARMKNPNAPIPSIVINTEDGQSIPLSKLEKADLQTSRGQATTDVNVQPLGIGIAADPVDKTVDVATEIRQALSNNKAIQGSNLHKVILNNPKLDQAGELGKAIKQATTEIIQNQIPFVKNYDVKTQKVMAIDAGEYLGILQLIHDTANFPKREAFLDFLETADLNNMMVIFPGTQNSQLQDSYGVQNTTTGHSIMISSKGGKGKTAAGAAPALSGLKIPAELAKTRKPGNGIDFILTMQSLSVKEQPFAAMNFLNRFYPDTVPDLYKKVLPFTDTDMQLILNNMSGKGSLPAKYNRIIKSRDVKARATAGGILFYATAKDLVETFNELQPIPDFRQAVLEVLDMNFVQIFARVVGGKLTADILWPGKVDGNVLLWTKAEAANPGSAGFSFKVID